MKILLTFAVTFAALASVSAASARAPSNGHYEWQNRPVYGPNKSNFPSRVRVWVKDASDMASCDRAMMHDNAKMANCMDMPNNGANHAKG